MRAKIFRHNVSFGFIAMAIGFSPAAFAAVEAPAAPYSTPLGITLADITAGLAGGGGGGGTDLLLWRRLGDVDGKPLYTFNNDGTAGKSTCVAECAKEFPPYLAAKGAAAFGAWSIVGRDDGTKQWAYEGRPLYRYSGAQPVPQRSNANSAEAQAKAKLDAMDPGSKANSPKEGWKLAAFLTGAAPAPPEFDLRSIATANGYAFVVAMTGQVLYVFKTAPKRINNGLRLMRPGSPKKWVTSPSSRAKTVSVSGLTSISLFTPTMTIMRPTISTACWRRKMRKSRSPIATTCRHR